MPTRAAALIVLILAAAVLGFAPILVRLADTGPAAAGFWRFAFALPLLLLMTARPGGEGIGRPSGWMMLAGGMLVLDLSFWHYSIALTSVANATTLTNLTPVVVTLVGWWVFRERPKALFVVALAAAIAGAVTMSLGADGGQGSNPPLGDAFAAVTALWYAGYFIAVKAARGRYSAGRVMLWSTAIAAPGLLMAALVLGEQILPGSWGGWAACVGLGVVHVVGQGGVAWSLGRLPTALTAVTVLIQPIAAAVLGWLLFAETLTPVQALGGAVVLAAIVLAQWSAAKKKGAEADAPAPVL
ncbi:DMT family transporter [Brevundimonas sp. UBA2416]|uniref:DMT family transporter n=1 Tax=Brevundimonas sp. UBA2416 TaxID=1946124 RepID=UPI0025B899EA|nr:DMT family transporter [Brevundimonas sp. UBA2416]